MTTINYTQAITSGIIDFETACALQGVGMTQAIREGVLDFETACKLQGMALEVSAPAPKAKPRKKAAPKAKPAPKAPKPEAEPKPEPVAEEPKADEPKYTKGGCVLQWDDGITASGTQKAAITKAYNALTKQGFAVTRKRVGTWVELYQSGDEKRPSKEFAAAKLDEGWVLVRGTWKYPELLKGYEDSFRPEN